MIGYSKEQELFTTIKRRKADYFRHIFRTNKYSFLCYLIKHRNSNFTSNQKSQINALTSSSVHSTSVGLAKFLMGYNAF